MEGLELKKGNWKMERMRAAKGMGDWIMKKDKQEGMIDNKQ